MNEALLQRLATLEGESAVRRVMARYMDLCDVPRVPTQVSELAELFCIDAIWEGVGRETAQTFGQQHRPAGNPGLVVRRQALRQSPWQVPRRWWTR